MADPWLLDVPAQEAYQDGTLVEPTVRHWDFRDGFDITYNSTTGRIEIRSGGGSFDWQESVRLATIAALPANTRTANVLLADGNGALTVDGTAAVVGNRVLVKNEGLGANNGIYVVNVIGDAATRWQMTRAVLADETGEITNGLRVYVSPDSATLGNQVWYCQTADPITVNTTALTFARVPEMSGPASVVDHGIARWDGTSGRLLQDTPCTISDAGVVAFANGATVTIGQESTAAGHGNKWTIQSQTTIEANSNGAELELRSGAGGVNGNGGDVVLRPAIGGASNGSTYIKTPGGTICFAVDPTGYVLIGGTAIMLESAIWAQSSSPVDGALGVNHNLAAQVFS